MNTLSVYKDIGDILNPDKKELSIKTSWEDIIYVSTRQLITCALSPTLKERKIFDKLPKELREYFSYIESLNKKRNKKILTQTQEIVKLLNSINITPILLKGVAHIFRGIYPNISARIIGDIDLLIPEEKGKEAISILLANGYKYFEYNASFKEHHHLNPLFHEEKIARVEVHTSPINPKYRELFSTDIYWKDAQYMEKDGAKLFLLSREDSIILNISHSGLSHRDYYFLRIPLRDLYDFFLLFREKDIDWEKIEKKFANYKGVYRSYLFMVNKIFSIARPQGKGFLIGERFHWYLNKLVLRYPKRKRLIIFSFILLKMFIDKEIRNMILSRINKLFRKKKRLKLLANLKKAINERRGEI